MTTNLELLKMHLTGKTYEYKDLGNGVFMVWFGRVTAYYVFRDNKLVEVQYD